MKIADGSGNVTLPIRFRNKKAEYLRQNDALLSPTRLELGEHMDGEVIRTVLMFSVRIWMGMDYSDPIHYVCMGEQCDSSDVPQEQQRKHGVANYASNFAHTTNCLRIYGKKIQKIFVHPKFCSTFAVPKQKHGFVGSNS